MIMATAALLKENKDPSEKDIQQGLSGHVCRCGGYLKIFDAVHEAAKKISVKD